MVQYHDVEHGAGVGDDELGLLAVLIHLEFNVLRERAGQAAPGNAGEVLLKIIDR